jgi:hypothetical protein
MLQMVIVEHGLPDPVPNHAAVHAVLAAWWRTGTHYVQESRRALVRELLAASREMPRPVAELCGAYVHS